MSSKDKTVSWSKKILQDAMPKSKAKAAAAPSRAIWTADYQVPDTARSRLTKADLATFPLYTEAPFDDDGWRRPPKYVALTDENLYWVTKHVPTKDRMAS